METDNMQYTDGTTTINYQHKQIESDAIRSNLYYDFPAYKEPEVVISDFVTLKKEYPFNLPLDNKITEVEFKLDKTNIDITGNRISANKAIFIEAHGSVLRVWNSQVTPHNVLGTQGNTYVDGYDILDFDNNMVKCAFTFNRYFWDIPYIGSLKRILLNGNGNDLILNDLDKNAAFRVLGKNKVYVGQTTFDSLTIGTTNSTFNFLDSVCDTLSANVRGTGNIQNLTVKTYANVTLIGSQQLLIKKMEGMLQDTVINGPGKIVFY